MGWSTPKTWASEPLTSSDMNQYIRDNQEALKDPPDAFYEIDAATDLTFTSTSWADLDSTNLVANLTTNGGDIRVVFQADIIQSAGAAYFSFDLDGTIVNSADDGIGRQNGAAAQILHIEWWFRGVAAGAHTIKVSAKVSAGTLTVYRGQATAGNKVIGLFTAREVS